MLFFQPRPPPEPAAFAQALQPAPPPPTATTLTDVTPAGAVHEYVPATTKEASPVTGKVAVDADRVGVPIKPATGAVPPEV